MKKNTLLITIFIFIILLASAGYGYYRFFVAPIAPPVIKEQPEIVLVGSHEIFSPGRALLISGNYAYVSAGRSIVNIVDISDPSNPVSIGLVGLSANMEEATALNVYNNYLYVAGDIGIEIFDISNPAKPKRVGFYLRSDPRSLTGIDNYLFVGTGHGLFILDISDPTKPTLVRKHSEDFVIDDLFLMDNLIYMVGQGKPVEVSPNVFESKNNIRVLDISNRTNPVLVGKYKKQMSLPRDIYIYNGIAYVVHLLPKDTLKILDASDLTNLTLLGNYEFEIDNIRMVKGVYVFDKYAYVISNKKLLILDISDPTKPILIKTVDQNSLYTISGIENYIYLISFSPEGVPQFQIFEIR